jgi:hypothetical protein
VVAEHQHERQQKQPQQSKEPIITNSISIMACMAL